MFLLLFSLACSEEKSEDTSTAEDTSTEDTGTENTDACEDLSVEDCHARADCYVRNGRQNTFDEENQCWNIGEPEELFCLGDVDCGDAETYAHAPDSEECWWFPSTCIPQGWTECSYPDEPECN